MRKQISPEKHVALALSLAGGFLCALAPASAVPDSTKYLNEIVVTANKFAEKRKNIACKVDVLDAAEIGMATSGNTAGLLEQSGKVFVQRSQQGGGSPVLRGFEASRILLLVDGVRMNNAIYRAGHLQNIITVDEDVLEKVEVLYGPASTLYGSDALGGVVSMHTKKPLLASGSNMLVKTNLATRYSSASSEYTGHAGLNLGWKKLALLTAVSFSSFGDLRQGGRRMSRFEDFGKRKEYIIRRDNTDQIVANPNENIQKFSGYNQFDLLQKVLWQPRNNQAHELNIQYSTSGNIPRYDRLTDVRDGRLRWAQWDYGPQLRFMTAYSYRAELTGFFDNLLVTTHYQKIRESRIQRPFAKVLQENRVEDLGVLGFNADLHRSKRRHELHTGADGQFNFLKSVAYNHDIVTGEKFYNLDTRYPDGKNRMNYVGVYVQHLYKLGEDKLILTDGLRANYIGLNATFRDTSILHLPFTGAVQDHLALSANAGLVYLAGTWGKASFQVATGFRAPNFDDLAKVFESAAGAQVVVPNPGLKPERTVNFDLGLTASLSGVTVELNGFYTAFKNAIVLDKYTFNGADQIHYGGKLTPVVASQNKAGAYSWGVQAGARYRLEGGVDLYSSLTYTYGRFRGADGSKVPLDHIPPVYGKTGIRYLHKGVKGEFYALYNGWKRVGRYNPYGEDNLQYATPAGMPGWYTLNLSAGYAVTRFLEIQAAVENILDRNYRVFASGISGAGRNLVLKLKAGF